MKILIVTHAAFEKPGCIESWAKKQDHEIQEVRPYMGEVLPDISGYDFLVVMGGPPSPLKIDKDPYLKDEINLIKQAIIKHKRILGICLGAQLIGEALGAQTERSPNKEIGMYPVELLEDAKFDPVFRRFPAKFDVIHWHNDMPGIPKGATLLLKSEGCPRQAFRYGDRIYAFQCHFEMTQELLKEMVKHCSSDIKEGTYIRSVTELVNTDCTQMNLKMESVLDYLASLPELVMQKDKEKTTR